MPQVFNAAEMRIRGTELEKFAASKARSRKDMVRKGAARSARGSGAGRAHKADSIPVGGTAATKSSKWRAQSSQLREAIRQVSSPPSCYS